MELDRAQNLHCHLRNCHSRRSPTRQMLFNKRMAKYHRIVQQLNGKELDYIVDEELLEKLLTEHKHLFELLRCTEIEYCSGTGRIHAPKHWWEAKIKENPKYVKYKNFDCNEMYDTYGKLFGDIGGSTKYVLSPTKLSLHDFDLGTDSEREYEGDKLPINAEATDSSGNPIEDRANLSMNISGKHSGDKRKCKHNKVKGKKKKYGARELSALLEQMVSVGTDLALIARSHHKGRMLVDECVDEFLSSGHVEEGDVLHLFALWFIRDKENSNSYCTAKIPCLRFKFVEYYLERDNLSLP